MFFENIHLEWRQILAIREICNTVTISTDADITFHFIIPVFYVLIADWPIYSDPFFSIRFKIQVTESITVLSPKKGSAAHLVATMPGKRLFLDVGIFGVLNQ